jgi:hypothetical protein
MFPLRCACGRHVIVLPDMGLSPILILTAPESRAFDDAAPGHLKEARSHRTTVLAGISRRQRVASGLTGPAVTSVTAPVASGWSGRRVELAPTGKRRLSTAHTRSGHSPKSRVASVMAIAHGIGSLRPDAGRLHDWPPFLCVGLLHCGERFRGLLFSRKNLAPELRKSRPHHRIGQRLDDGRIELVNDVPCPAGRIVPPIRNR